MSRELHRALSDLPGVGRRQRAGLFAGLFLSLLAGFSWASTAHGATPSGTFQGDAYGTFAHVKSGPLTGTLGYTAFISCPCRGTAGHTLSNVVNSLSAGHNGNVLKAATILSTVHTNETTAAASETNTSRIQGLNALNGTITADAVLAVANTTIDATTINRNAVGSAFVNLKIAGKLISATPPPNTRIDIRGIGFVILNQEITSGNGTSAGSIVVQMIVINITTANSFGLEVGAQIIVAHARSGFLRLPPGAGLVSGSAWAASANAAIGNDLSNHIGLLAFVSLPCEGTNGTTFTNSIAAFSISPFPFSPLLSLGTGVTTAFGGPTSSGAIAKTTATVQNVTELSGLIKASTVTAVAQTTIANGVRTRSTQGSGLLGLTVLGITVNNPAPNTRITLPGLGYVIVNEQIILPASSNAETQVNGIHIFITITNPELPVGAQVIVAHAGAAAQSL